jgi:hypothetical protein
MKSLPCFTNGGFDSSFYILLSRQTMIFFKETGFFDSLILNMVRTASKRQWDKSVTCVVRCRRPSGQPTNWTTWAGIAFGSIFAETQLPHRRTPTRPAMLREEVGVWGVAVVA